MKPWIKKTLFGLFGASILAGGLAACSHHGPGHYSSMSSEEAVEFRGKMAARVASKLDLNAEQKQRLAILMDKLHEQRTALMGDTQDPRTEVKALVAGAKFDKARAQALVTEKTTALQSKSPEVIAALADFYDGLNAEQQQKVRDFMAHRGGWFHHG